MQSLNDNLLGKRFAAVELFSDDGEKAAVLSIRKSKNELLIERQTVVNAAETDWTQALEAIPVCLVVNNQQVIQKEVDGIDISDEKLLYKAFPNFNSADFYFEIWRLRTKSVVAISRKNYIDGLLAGFKEKNIHPAGVSFGIAVMSEIIKFSDGQRLYARNCMVLNELEEIAWEDHASQTNDINGLEVPGTYMLGFAAILRLLAPQSGTSGNSVALTKKLLYNYNQNAFFSKGIKIMIGSLLLLLSLNFFAFNYYFNKNQELDVHLDANQSEAVAAEKLKSRIKAKEEKLKKIQLEDASRSSFVINEIGKSIPSTVLLSELVYNPLSKKIKPEEPLPLEEKVILLSGSTIDNTSFTRWIEKLEQLRFVDNTVITKFGNSETTANDFTIKIIIAGDEVK